MSNGLNWDTRQRIDALVSVNKRLMGEKKELLQRVAVLEGIAQANADDRDAYMERAAELEDERDRARATAVALENQLAEVGDQLADTERIYEAAYYKTGNPTDGAGLSAVQDCTTSFDVATDVVLGDLCEDVTGRADA